MELATLLKSALVEADAQRDRSTQVEIGASSVGGCRRAAWHIIQQTPKTNHDTENLASILGSAIHGVIAEALTKYDVFGEDFEIEFPLQIAELKGNCDFYSKSAKLIADWKSVTLAKIATGRWLDAQKKMQVNLYGYMKNQIEPGSVEQVALVAIPRDGKFADLAVWQAPYDEKLALKGLAWLKEIKEATAAPAPERSPVFFCRSYCSYYDESGVIGCQGK